MHSITQEIDFCYGHRLVGHPGPCKHLHGHNARVEMTFVANKLDERGMVLDFTEVKAKMKTWIDETLDHQMVLHKSDPILPVLQEHEESIVVTEIPPTAEHLARLIFNQARSFGLPISRVDVWETPRQKASFFEE